MSIAYLPVNKNWQLYIDRSQAKYDELQSQLSSMLTRLAKEAVELPKERFVIAFHQSYILPTLFVGFIRVYFIYLFPEFRMQQYKQQNSRVHNKIYTYVDTKGRMCCLLHSTNKTRVGVGAQYKHDGQSLVQSLGSEPTDDSVINPGTGLVLFLPGL